MPRPPKRRTLIAIAVAVGVFEGDLRNVLLGQPRLEGNQAAVQRQRVARQRKGGAVARQIAARAGIPGAEIFKVETDETEVIAIQAEAELVIVVVKNRMAVE